MGTYTTNYNLFMPTVGETGWGTLVNGNFETIDTTMKSLSNRVTTCESYGARITAIENEVNGALSCTSVTTSGKITGNGGIAGTTGTFSGAVTGASFNGWKPDYSILALPTNGMYTSYINKGTVYIGSGGVSLRFSSTYPVMRDSLYTVTMTNVRPYFMVNSVPYFINDVITNGQSLTYNIGVSSSQSNACVVTVNNKSITTSSNHSNTISITRNEFLDIVKNGCTIKFTRPSGISTSSVNSIAIGVSTTEFGIVKN